MANFNMSDKQLLAKMYNARSAIESIISMVKEELISPEMAYIGVQKRLQSIFAENEKNDNIPI